MVCWTLNRTRRTCRRVQLAGIEEGTTGGEEKCAGTDYRQKGTGCSWDRGQLCGTRRGRMFARVAQVPEVNVERQLVYG
jgi:hypothetical protein